MAEWAVKGEQLCLRELTTWRPATAREVAEATAAHGQDLRGATGLHFARIALAPEVVLVGELPDAVRICVAVRRGTTLIPVPARESQGVIHESRWHPLDVAFARDCFAFLDKHALTQDSLIPLGAYLAIKADVAGTVSVLDNTGRQEDSAPARIPTNFNGSGLRIDLFPYQQIGAEFLVAMADRDVGALLADQMGLGKTAQAIALLLHQRERGPSLVVCPASLLRNWSREIAHVAPTLAVITHAGPQRTGVSSGLEGHDVVLTSYETLVSDLSFLSDISWNVIALDEAQMVRNPDTARSRSVKSLTRRVSLALTGTPVENRLLDLWSIAEFVVPAVLGTREAFEALFPDELERAESLGQIVAPITLRRLVADVASDLPPIINIETAFELPPQAALRYAQTMTESAGPLAATTALRVLCAHADGDGWPPATVAPKIDHTMRILGEAFSSGEKVLLFASFQETLDRIFETVAYAHPNAFLAVLDGRVPVADRQTIIDQFADYPGAGALFMNPQAAGVGLNITAANHVVHFNPEWNPALTSQATARAYRRKQTLPVTVHHLFYEQTVEEKALMRADWKRTLARGVDDGATDMNEGSTI